MHEHNFLFHFIYSLLGIAGSRIRRRECIGGQPGIDCPGPSQEDLLCNAGNGDWSPWLPWNACSVRVDQQKQYQKVARDNLIFRAIRKVLSALLTRLRLLHKHCETVVM